MNTLRSIQDWYFSQCNGDWEHSCGIKIDNIDNPGWVVKIDLRDTELESAVFSEVSYGMSDNAEARGHEWLLCRRTEAEFEGCGGPFKLEEILEIFLKWTREHSVNDGPMQTADIDA